MHCRGLRFRHSIYWSLLAGLVLTGCAVEPKTSSSRASLEPAKSSVPTPVPVAPPATAKPVPQAAHPVLPAAGSGRGGYYQDDGPGDQTPENLLATPDPEPKLEPYSKSGNRPYKVFGKLYTPITHNEPFSQRGIGSWYGKKFHGQKTSSGERYDMYQLTAAHPTLPIPSYARVSNLRNGQQVIVRVNDRGPFHSNRIIDLSYTAALKLGYLSSGSAELFVERLLPNDIVRLAQAPKPDSLKSSSQLQGSVKSLPPVAATVDEPVAPADIALMMQTDRVSDSTAQVSKNLAATSEAAGDTTTMKGGNTAYYLQLSAFGQVANAEAAQQRLVQNWPANQAALRIVFSGNLYRLYSGPYPSQVDAANAARWLQDGGWLLSMPLIVPLTLPAQ